MFFPAIRQPFPYVCVGSDSIFVCLDPETDCIFYHKRLEYRIICDTAYISEAVDAMSLADRNRQEYETLNLHFKPITKHNQAQALELQIYKSQKGFVESVSQCLAEAAQSRRWHPVGIYDGETMIGFAMYGFFLWPYLPLGKLWLDRLLIDQAHQNKGYGAAALQALVNHLTRKYHCKKIYLSVVKENIIAIQLYKRHGFRFNGQRDVHGEYVMEKKIDH